MRRAGAWLMLFGVTLMASAHADQERLQKHLLVVYNENAPESERLARYYAVRRQIPPERVLGLNCPDQEFVTREIFNKQIREPIDNYLVQQGWLRRKPGTVTLGKMTYTIFTAEQNEIWSIVLIRGIPLRIDQDNSIAPEPGTQDALKTNAAAVDSELATLPTLGLPLSGVWPSTYFAAGYDREFDLLDARQMILVARLDAPTPEIVQRMINDAVEVEPQRLAGRAYLDARALGPDNKGYYVGDQWFYQAQTDLKKHGWVIDFDEKPEVVPANRPWAEAALYLGWYTDNAVGPMLRPGTFRPGAVAYHLHSFSATTLRSMTAGWAGPLLAAGATVTMGNVLEPYLDLTPHVNVFTQRLLQGYTFGEAAYASIRALSWMTTVVGDPLYQPFKAPLRPEPIEAVAVLGMKGEWQSIQAVIKELREQRVTVPEKVEEAFATGTLSGLASMESCGDYLSEAGTIPAALASYEKAQAQAREAVDVIRVAEKRAQLLAGQKEWEKAYAVLLDAAVRVPKDLATYGFPEMILEISRKPGAPPLPARLNAVANPVSR